MQTRRTDDMKGPRIRHGRVYLAKTKREGVDVLTPA